MSKDADYQRIRLAMVCLPAPEELDSDAIVAAYARRFPGDEPFELTGDGEATLKELGIRDEGAQAVAGKLGADTVLLHRIDAPIPWEDLEGPCEVAFDWDEAEPVLRAHEAHVVCVLIGGVDAEIERTLRLTRLVGAVAAGTQATAVYWGEAPLVKSRAAFLEQSAQLSRAEPPIELWVGFQPSVEKVKGRERFSVFTFGMAPLGLMEIEVHGAERTERVEVIDLVAGIARYLIDKGMVISDGDTVGISPQFKILARYVDSAWDREGPVLLLEVP
ncbi:MAG TPA: hypothetical protein DEA08_17490 [Planctomycetes bacterium]|nr:hypothetical protein [Planctomycetota bacterium]